MMNEIKYQRIMDLAENGIENAESKGEALLEESIERLENYLHDLKSVLGRYREGDAFDKAGMLCYAAEILANATHNNMSGPIAEAAGMLGIHARLAQCVGITNK